MADYPIRIRTGIEDMIVGSNMVGIDDELKQLLEGGG